MDKKDNDNDEEKYQADISDKTEGDSYEANTLSDKTNENKGKEGNEAQKNELKSDENDSAANEEMTEGDEDKETEIPKEIYFILGNGFFERFSFYGLRTILTLYLTDQLNYYDNEATQFYHGFKMASYLTPLLGAILADSWLGRFSTILYISVINTFGYIIIAIGSIPMKFTIMKAVSLTGLFIVAFGTGCIKLCVSAFGGDQFKSDQNEQREIFYIMFYFIINSGTLFSTVITPVLRGDIRCFGEEDCFPLAFIFIAIFYAIALALFIIGKPMYCIKAAEGSVFISFFKCISHALARKITFRGEKKKHWLNYADDKYDTGLIDDIKSLFRVLFMYIPLPVFWTLFEQQGSKWVLQAARMNGQVFMFHIKPDQMQLINPLLILVLIPVFQNFIYPRLDKCKICQKYLQKMTLGGFLVAFSFILSGFVQMVIETELPVPPSDGYSKLLIINNSPCNLAISGSLNVSLAQFTHLDVDSNVLGEDVTWKFSTSDCNATTQKTFRAISVYESMMVTVLDGNLQIFISNDSRIKLKNGNSRIRLFFDTEYVFTENVNASFLIKGTKECRQYPSIITLPGKIGMTSYCNIKPDTYKIYMPINGTNHEKAPMGEVRLRAGGSYIIYIYRNISGSTAKLHSVETVAHNSVHILFQLPQGIVITVGEIMLSITGLEFSYSQAPLSMKCVVQVCWLTTGAIGNLLVILLARFLQFEKQSYEFFMYAGIMIFGTFIFVFLAYFYKYVEQEERD